jgi:hypothetical protein
VIQFCSQKAQIHTISSLCWKLQNRTGARFLNLESISYSRKTVQVHGFAVFTTPSQGTSQTGAGRELMELP